LPGEAMVLRVVEVVQAGMKERAMAVASVAIRVRNECVVVMGIGEG